MRRFIFIFTLIYSIGTLTFAQTNSQSVFVSPTDQNLTIKSACIYPVTDNVNGIYAKALFDELTQTFNSDAQWSLSKTELKPLSAKIFLDESPKEVIKLLKSCDGQALFETTVSKSLRGININLTMYTADGLPLLQETLKDYSGFDVADIRQQVKKLFIQLKSRLPFKGLLLSRRGQDVTVNLGSNYGLKAGMNITVIQITKVNRHPKLHFMIGSEKEVLGQIKLSKVDANLSFGSITYEREAGAVSVNSKILAEDFIKYVSPTLSADGKVLQDLDKRQDKTLSYGDNPQEWRPEANPQYGRATILVGLSKYEQNTTIINTGAVNGSNPLAPQLDLSAELWINANWFTNIRFRQAVFSINNDQGGSTPSRLNMSMGEYAVAGGYNFLMSDDFFGPKLQLSAGFADSKFSVDNSSPTTFTSMEYSGIVFQLGGQFPISELLPYDLGAHFDWWFNPKVSESSSSGSDSTSVNNFGLFVNYHMKKRLNIKTELDFEYYKSDFSGTATRSNPASGTSHRLTTVFAGIEYLF